MTVKLNEWDVECSGCKRKIHLGECGTSHVIIALCPDCYKPITKSEKGN